MSATAISTNLIPSLLERHPGPEVLMALRRKALEQAASLSLPAKNLEPWRKVRLDGVDPASWDGENSRSSLTVEAPSGVSVLRFIDTEGAALDRIEKRLIQALDEYKDDIFAMYGLALYDQARYIEAKGVVEQPVVVHHTLTAGNVQSTRSFIRVEPGAEVTVIEIFDSGESLPSDGSVRTWTPACDVSVGKNGKLNYIAIRRYGEDDCHFHRFHSTQDRDSRIHLSLVHTGGFTGKSFYSAEVNGEGGEFRGIGLGVLENREFANLEMVVSHSASHTNSSLLYKTVLKDRAHSIFDGNLQIPSGLKYVDSYQLNNNMLLNPKARAESMPRLVTKAEGVSCEHGATVGELDEDALFFLKSRGLPENDARQILIEAFVASLVEEIPAPDLHESILDSLKGKISI